MTRAVTTIIGANYGDEGKGLITDFECRRQGAKLVARFNGGAQAGHTVVTDSGKCHAFGHVSAGTFAGAKTYLSSNFLVNPLVLEKELIKLGADAPTVYAHPEAKVTTIYDMVLNAMAELARIWRHGSCGLGINETVTRYAAGYGFNVGMLRNQSLAHVARVFELIRHEWVPKRIEELGIKFDPKTDSASKQQAILPLLRVLNDLDFKEHARKLVDATKGIDIQIPDISADQELVLEGAQGLALDENLGVFPHVTRSITGLPSAIHTASELGHKVVSPVYVTRCYLTRHGAGPLPFEGTPFTEDGSVPTDSTNVPNQWQGTLRYAPLNLPQLAELIMKDLDRGRGCAKMYDSHVVNPSIAVTCLDQVQNVTMIGMDGAKVTVPSSNAAQFIANAVRLPLSHSSRGETAANVTHVVQ